MKDFNENLNENGEPETAPQQDVGVEGAELMTAQRPDADNVGVGEKMVGFKLDANHRNMLNEIVAVYRRTIRAQIELWIEFENLRIAHERKMIGVA